MIQWNTAIILQKHQEVYGSIAKMITQECLSYLSSKQKDLLLVLIPKMLK